MQILSSAMLADPSSRLHVAPDGLPVPGRLSLAFSSAADRDCIQRILNPDVKRIIDPASWVVKRESHVHDPHVGNGAFAMLLDENGDARAITCATASRTRQSEHTQARHPWTASARSARPSPPSTAGQVPSSLLQQRSRRSWTNRAHCPSSQRLCRKTRNPCAHIEASAIKA